MQRPVPFNLVRGPPPQPQEDDFSITEPLAYMQRGLPAAYDYADYIYIVDERIGDVTTKPARRDFKAILKNPATFKA